MEALPAARRPDAEEVGIVRHFYLSFLAGDVDADGQPLTVGVVRGQRRVFRLFHVLLEEEAQGGVREGKEEVIVGIEGVGVAGEAVREQLQLVVGGTGGHDAAFVEPGLQIRGHGCNLVRRAAHEDVEVAVHQQGAVHGQPVQHFLNVGLGYPVARVGHRAVAFGLGLQLSKEFALLGYLHGLVVHHAVCMGHV